jgi:hypothetical protein
MPGGVAFSFFHPNPEDGFLFLLKGGFILRVLLRYDRR